MKNNLKMKWDENKTNFIKRRKKEHLEGVIELIKREINKRLYDTNAIKINIKNEIWKKVAQVG